MKERLSKLPEDTLYNLQEHLWDVESNVSRLDDYTVVLFWFFCAVACFVWNRAEAIKNLEKQVEKLERELEDWR
mgnify:CR=1 FL=1